MAKNEEDQCLAVQLTRVPPNGVIASDSRLSVVSMFSGCGGMDLGFVGGFEYRGASYPRLPVKLLGAYDNDRKSKRTYDTNFDQELELLDLNKTDVSKVPSADVLIGGFPCQEFSACGPRGGIDARRGGLFRTMSRYAAHHKPAVVVAENVDHLRFINGGADLKTIRRSLARAGYTVQVWPVYAPDFGVPQTRRRIFIVGVRNDLPSTLNPPKATFAEHHRSTSWAIEDLAGISDETVANQSQYFKAALAKQGHGQGDEVNSRDLPAYTIRANSRSRVQFHYELPRRLTVRECARIQTFPDNFIFPDEATPSIRQIGNAVPPVLAHAIAQHVTNYLSGLPKTKIKIRSRHGEAEA
jgi:DNA (cytosine-5)-methyltransferase 1